VLGLNITNESPESYHAYKANLNMADEQGVTGTLEKYDLDALVMPTFASFHLPAIAGLPVVTVPLGFYPPDTKPVWNPKRTAISVAPHIPFGIAFVGRRWSEETLLALAYAFEQKTMARRKMRPYIAPRFELGDQTSSATGRFESSDPRHAFAVVEAIQGSLRRIVNRLVSTHRWNWAVLGLFETLP